MRICFLGTGGYHPNQRRHTACVLVPELAVAFDAGTAAFRLAEQIAGPNLSLFLSHAHWDHIIGLTYLLVPMMRGELQSVTLYGTRRTIDAVNNLLFAEPTFPVRPPFACVALDATSQISLPGGVCVRHWPQVTHPGGSTGFRLEWDDARGTRSLCYVTDTSVDGTYTQAVHQTDLLIHECYFPDAMSEWAQKTGHATLGDVLRLAGEAQARRLALVHLDPQLADDEALGLSEVGEVPVPVQIMRDLDVLEV